jgi:hypothetical protein
MVQWLMTALLVAGCFAYAAKMFWPKVLTLTNAADTKGSGCGGGCNGCAQSAGASASDSAVTKSCGSSQATVHPIVFQVPSSRKL